MNPVPSGTSVIVDTPGDTQPSQRGDGTRTVVVTGASAGVGRAAVRAFARRGDRVALLARGGDGLRAAEREVEALGGVALSVPTDVADPDQVDAAAERTEQTLGPVDVWVNNAMTSVFAWFTDVTPQEYRQVTDVTYHGTVYGTLAALRRMLPRNTGRIVQVGSALAYRGIPLQAAYCGAKHAVQGFTDSVRAELRHDGSAVTISMVHLPALNTPQFRLVRSRLPRQAQPVPPIFQPELAADAIVYAADHGTREVHVGGSTAATILGNKLASRLLDRYLARTGVDDQQTDDPETERPDNLFDPVPGDHGAHGVFDDRSRDGSWQWWLRRHRQAVAASSAVVAGVVGAGVAAAVRRNR